MEENKQLGTTEVFLALFGKKADRFLEELQKTGYTFQDEFLERYEELTRLAHVVKQDTHDKECWQAVEGRLQHVGEELKKAFKAAFRKREQTQQEASLPHETCL